MTDFDRIEEAIAPYRIGDRTASAALLAWFLENVWRMEPEDVDDAICDGSNDKGIDALTVDDDLGEITIFQTKHRQSEPRRQSDVDLTQLVGTAAYFQTTDRVDRLLQAHPNDELA